MRKSARRRTPSGDGVAFSLSYRPPYRFAELLAFFRARQLEGVEAVDEHAYARVVRMQHGDEEVLGCCLLYTSRCV